MFDSMHLLLGKSCEGQICKPMHFCPQESEDEQLARAIAASLGQETTSSSAAELVPQAAPQVAAAPKIPPI